MDVLDTARAALDAASGQILDDYRIWVVDDAEAKPRYGDIPAYDTVNAAIGAIDAHRACAPTVAAQQCGLESKLDPKGLEAAQQATRPACAISNEDMEAAIRAYLTTLAPADNGLVERLRAQADSEPAGMDTFYRRLFTETADRLTALRADRTAQAAEIERLKASEDAAYKIIGRLERYAIEDTMYDGRPVAAWCAAYADRSAREGGNGNG